MTRVSIPDDTVANALGAHDVARTFEAAGATVRRPSSHGLQWLEPLVEIDGQGFANVTPADVGGILAGRSQTAIGPIADHPFLTAQTRLTFARAGRTVPLNLAEYAATGGFEGLAIARARAPEDVVEIVTASGLRGRGGAGFPAGIKWNTVRGAAGPQKYVVCNADEGDSGTYADRMILEGDPFALLEGMAIAGHAVGATIGFVYIRSEYPLAIRRMEMAVRLAAPHIAPFTVKIRVGAGAYVCGEETSLLNSLEGKRGEVRAKPPLPAIAGLFGQPTVVNNVLTLAAVPHIFRDGPEAYAALGAGRSRGTVAIQLAGNVAHPGLFEAPFGLPLRTLVEEIGGGTASGRPVKAVQVGGPLGAYIPPENFDLPFDYEAFSAAEALIGHAGIVVFDDTADMWALARFAMHFAAEESCGKCTPCRIGSVRGVETLDRIRAGGRGPTPLEAAPQTRNAKGRPRTLHDEIALLTDLCDTMQAGSLCALGGFAPYPVLSALTHWPEDFGVKRVPEAAE
ncbi:MAG: NADH-ubiquinone oxidoreductase-F iron-sulfur binding region domain-containing protein [Pseudomonadota bacterium]